MERKEKCRWKNNAYVYQFPERAEGVQSLTGELPGARSQLRKLTMRLKYY